MGYVYRYTDLDDNIIKYVGIVWSNYRKLQHRLKEHEINDEWCKNKKWKIEYITENINTRTDAEYFESHYISLFKTDKYYNKNKSGWGISSFLPNREGDWKIYSDASFCESDYIFKVYIKDNKEFCIETIPVIKKLCKTKDSNSIDYHCRCGSNEIYKVNNGVGQLYCKECGLWVKQCDKSDNLSYTPEYNGKYVVDNNNEIIMYEYYVVDSNSKQFKGYKKDELKDVISMSAYALTEDEIEGAKLKILNYINEKQKSDLLLIEKQIVKLKEKLDEFKKCHNDLIFNFSSYLN